MKCAAIVAAVAAFACLPSPAAATEKAMQDDRVMVYEPSNRDLALDQFQAAGGQWVRINVYHERGPEKYPTEFGMDTHAAIEQYDDAVSAIETRGLNVELTLVWYGMSDPQQYAAWAGDMAAHFGALGVRRFSVMNEPDLTIQGASDVCDDTDVIEQAGTTLSQTYSSMLLTRVSKNKVQSIRTRIKFLRHGKVRWHTVRRFVVKGTKRPFLVRRYVVKKHKRYARFYRRSARIGMRMWTTPGYQTITARAGCFALWRGRKYRAIALAAIPVIRRNAPGAQVLVGETSPVRGVVAFINEVGYLPADGWAHHPYDGQEIDTSNLGAITRMTGLPVYATEYGRAHDADDDEDRPVELGAGIRRAIGQGAVQVLQYGWFTRQANWDTALLREADGSTTPEYDTFRASF